MLYLALSVLSSTLIFVVFKLYTRYRVETLFAIIINYVVACATGLFFYEGEVLLPEIPGKSWFGGTVALGILFIVVFNLMAATAQRLGVSVASVATKMSLAIPVLFGVAMYGEELGPIKITGILLALAAVYFTSVKEKRMGLSTAQGKTIETTKTKKQILSVSEIEAKTVASIETMGTSATSATTEKAAKMPKTETEKFNENLAAEKSKGIKKWALLLPVAVFVGSGIIDTSIKYFQEFHMEQKDYPIFSASIFAVAALTGFLFILVKSPKKSLKINFRNVLGGVALGVPNYFSIYFLLLALKHDSLNSASVFTINNVAIVMFSTLVGILLFKERVSAKNWAGIGLAVVSIVLVALF